MEDFALFMVLMIAGPYIICAVPFAIFCWVMLGWYQLVCAKEWCVESYHAKKLIPLSEWKVIPFFLFYVGLSAVGISYLVQFVKWIIS